jgi:hypothetical protein
MAFFIFTKNCDNIENSLCRIAENQSDLDSLNIAKGNYKIIEDSQENFNTVKYGTRFSLKYNENTIVYDNLTLLFKDKQALNNYVKNFKNSIKKFLERNQNHQLFNRWNDYYNQLNSLNLDTITYPLNKSLEQYFNDLGQPSLSPLQIP